MGELVLGHTVAPGHPADESPTVFSFHIVPLIQTKLIALWNQ